MQELDELGRSQNTQKIKLKELDRDRESFKQEIEIVKQDYKRALESSSLVQNDEVGLPCSLKVRETLFNTLMQLEQNLKSIQDNEAQSRRALESVESKIAQLESRRTTNSPDTELIERAKKNVSEKLSKKSKELTSARKYGITNEILSPRSGLTDAEDKLLAAGFALKSPRYYNKLLNSTKRKIQELERQREATREAYMQAQLKLHACKRQVEDLNQRMVSLQDTIDRCNAIRDDRCQRTNDLFFLLLRKNMASGKLEFDHAHKRLNMKVHKDDNMDNTLW